MVLLNKQMLESLAHQYGFIRDNLEKVIRLVSILDYIYRNSRLSNSLVLKGGTAINLVEFAMPRLSVDIDLDFAIPCSREQMLVERAHINDELLRYMEQESYILLPNTKNPHTLDSWVFGYINAGGNRDVIKIEINYSNRCHVLPIETKRVTIDYLQQISINTLASVELFASKINALLNRGAMRDMYDVRNMIQQGLFTSPYEQDLLRKTVVFYMTVGSSMPVGDIPTSFTDFPQLENISFAKIRAQLLPVLRRTEKFDFVEAKDLVIQWLQQFLIFSPQEIEYIKLFNQHQFKPEILFEDQNICSRIQNHPMALWKMSQG